MFITTVSIPSISASADNTQKIEVGDIITFGKYEQDGNSSNGKEDIEWQVLSVQNNKILVISQYALDVKPYNTTRTDVTWETCTLRKWLNNEFLNNAFLIDEQTHIPSVYLKNEDNLDYGVNGGNKTYDKIFCLSLEEAEKLFGNYTWYTNENFYYGYNPNLFCAPTQYTIKKGAFVFDIDEEYYLDNLKDKCYPSDFIGHRGVCWWLRTPGGDSDNACDVSSVGNAGSSLCREVNFDCYTVRPAMYLDKEFAEKLKNPENNKPKNITYKGYSASFDVNDLAESSIIPNKNLALICGFLSKAVYHDDSNHDDLRLLSQMGFENYYSDYLDNDFCYSIGYEDFMIDGVDTNVIIFSIRGTKSDEEKRRDRVMDAGTYKNYGCRIFDLPYEFEQTVMDGFNTLLSEHPELETKPLKIIITGHSLGGATANLLATRFTTHVDSGAWWSPLLDKDDIFCYTFGAIDSKDCYDPNHPYTVSADYENIHNVYNVLDTYGIFGNSIITTNGNKIFGKFGHMDFFARNEQYSIFDNGKNHDIMLYIDSVYQDLTNGNVICWENDTANTIVWTLAFIKCPVDVDVYNGDTLVGRVKDNEVDTSVTTIPICCDGEEKYICFDKKGDYRIEINATDEGSFEYACFDLNNPSSNSIYTNVELKKDKKMVSTVEVGGNIQEVPLLVTDDDGTVLAEVNHDGTEETVNNNESNDGLKNFVKRFYTIILEREEVKDEEIEYYTSRLLSKELDGAYVARGFVMSPEYTGKGEDNLMFVNKMYAAFFNREADDAPFYINLLESGQSREVVLAGFINSPEFKALCADYGINPGELIVNTENNNQENNQSNNPSDDVTKLNLDTSNVNPEKLDEYVRNLYLKILGREYDEEGLAYWKEQIMAGTTYDAATAARVGFFESEEYKNKNKTSEQFVTDCYHAFLGREPELDGLSYWMDKIDSGEYSKQKVIDLGFGHSDEFQNILRGCGFRILE